MVLEIIGKSVRRRKDVEGEPWQAIVRYRSDGKSHTKSVTLAGMRATRNDALKELAEIEKSLQSLKDSYAVTCDGNSITVGEYLEKYIEDQAAMHTIEPSTAMDYREYLRHLEPITSVPITELTFRQVEAEQRRLCAIYAPSTVRKCMVVLNLACKHAMVDGTGLLVNPCAGLKKPNWRMAPNGLSPHDAKLVATLLPEYLPKPWAIACIVALNTGMRANEIAALRWANVDMAGGVIHVVEAFGWCENGRYLKSTKNNHRRDIPISSALMDALKCSKGNPYVIEGKKKGTAAQAENASNRWREFATKYGLVGAQGKRPTFHDLRHTFATLMVAQGVDIKTIQSIMGHASAAMTLDVYASADRDAVMRSVSAIDAMLS